MGLREEVMVTDIGRVGSAETCSRASMEPASGLHPTGFDQARGDFLTHLRQVNSERLAAWEGATKADTLFHAAELGGEVGELLNVAKKLHREAMGWRGSRASLSELAEEIGDVLICLDKLAAQFGIDLASATAAKFNQTSDKVGLPQKLTDPNWLCGACGRSQGSTSTHCAPPFAVLPHRFDGSHPADQRRAAIATEARRAETGTGSVHEGADPKGIAPERAA